MVGPGDRPRRAPAVPGGDADRGGPRPSLDRPRLGLGRRGRGLWYAMEIVEGPSLAESRGPPARGGGGRAPRRGSRGRARLQPRPRRPPPRREAREHPPRRGRPAEAHGLRDRKERGQLRADADGLPRRVARLRLSGAALGRRRWTGARTSIPSGRRCSSSSPGRLPFRSRGIEDLARRLDDDAPPLSRFRADADPELERIVGKALARDRRDRYDAAGLRDALRAFLARGSGAEGAETGAAVPAAPRASERRLLRVALVGTLILAAAVAALLLAR